MISQCKYHIDTLAFGKKSCIYYNSLMCFRFAQFIDEGHKLL